MKRFVFLWLISLVFIDLFQIPEIGNCANLIWREDFEDNSYLDTFGLSSGTVSNAWDGYVITTNNPHSGSRSMRGNINNDSGAVDSITGAPAGQVGAGTYLNFGDSGTLQKGTNHNFYDAHRNEFYVSYWMKLDNPFYTNSSWDSGQPAWKLFFTNGGNGVCLPVGGVTPNMRFTSSGVTVSSYGGGTTCNFSEAESYDSASINMANDGQWHRFQIYVYYGTAGNNDGILKVWVDGALRQNRTNLQLRSTSTGRFSRLTIGHWHQGEIFGYCTESTGKKCGWQLDDLEVWDGNPSASGIPIETNLKNPSPPQQLIIK